jgi:hypothetical protein
LIRIVLFSFSFDYKIAGKGAETAGYRWQPGAILNPVEPMRINPLLFPFNTSSGAPEHEAFRDTVPGYLHNCLCLPYGRFYVLFTGHQTCLQIVQISFSKSVGFAQVIR